MLVLGGRAVLYDLAVKERVQRGGHVGAVVGSGQNGVLIQDAVTGETKGSPAQPMLREILVPVPRSDA